MSRIDCQISPEWANVRELRAKVSDVLSTESESIRNATCMVVSELLENAIKYGEPSSDRPKIDFALNVDAGLIEVRVTSVVSRSEHLQRLARRIQEVNESGGADLHFINRIGEFLMDSKQLGGLGIYRIGVEAGFTLSLKHEGDVLAVIARRATV